MALYSIDGGLLASQVACFVGSSFPEHSPCTVISHKGACNPEQTVEFAVGQVAGAKA